MYTDDLAEELKENAGKKWRPSNGTEGQIFMEEYCYNCIHDDPDNRVYCNIIAESMAYETDDPQYPKEWQIGKDGQPICTNYKQKA